MTNGEDGAKELKLFVMFLFLRFGIRGCFEQATKKSHPQR